MSLDDQSQVVVSFSLNKVLHKGRARGQTVRRNEKVSLSPYIFAEFISQFGHPSAHCN